MMFRKIKKGSNAKELALKWFSKYIRLRDALRTTGTKTQALCVTCGERQYIERMDAGHGIPGRSNGILFDEDIVFAQCRSCNRSRGGEYQAFKTKLVGMHSEDWFEVKQQARRTPVQISDLEFSTIAKEYHDKYKAILGGE